MTLSICTIIHVQLVLACTHQRETILHNCWSYWHMYQLSYSPDVACSKYVTHIHVCIWIYTCTHTRTHAHTHTHTHTHDIHIHTCIDICSHAHTDRHRKTDRQTDRQTHTHLDSTNGLPGHVVGRITTKGQYNYHHLIPACVYIITTCSVHVLNIINNISYACTVHNSVSVITIAFRVGS